MKLALSHLSQIDALLEFDVWLTPTLGEIRDTDRFQQEMQSVVKIFEALGISTANFTLKTKPDISKISESIETEIAKSDDEVAKSFLLSIADLLFLVTGKSDNNCKCQLPIYIRQKNIFKEMPKVSKN